MLKKLLNLCDKNTTLFSATIELLTKCNWRCKHCYIPNRDNIGLDKNVVFDIFKQLRDMGTFELVLTGGEIFYRSDILDIIKKARDMKFKVTLLSNISLMNEEIIKQLAKLSIYNISCTIFSLDENIHDSITGISGSLKKALSNVMLLKKYNIPLQIKTVIMKDNYNSYKQVKVFCEENGFDYFPSTIVSAKHNGDKYPLELRISNSELEETFNYIDDVNIINKRHISQEDYVCDTLRYSLNIDSYGNVYPCNAFNTPIGNIFKNSIKDIWTNSKELSYIRSLKWKDLKECNNCDNKDYCFKCPGLTSLENNNILAKSSLACQHANIRHKLYYRKEDI